MDKIVGKITDICDRLSIPTSRTILYVHIPTQKMLHIMSGTLSKTFQISTSLKPPSCVEDSLGTPTGLHRIEQKIGDEERAGTVFFARVSTKKAFWDFEDAIQERNLITSRIMWLRGIEPEKNAGPGLDSFKRYIYIHGTNHEDRLGTPASGGCVLMGNEDIIRLYDRMPAGSMVYIDDDENLTDFVNNDQ